jgi:predicted ester cyclase
MNMSRESAATRHNKQVVAQFLRGTHSNESADVEIIDSTVAEGIVCHGFPGGDPYDRESYKDFFRKFQQRFADLEFTVFSLVGDDEYVCARWQVRARHVARFAGVDATRNPVCFEGMVQYRMQDGMIAETWLSMDSLKLMSDIGAIPARERAA